MAYSLNHELWSGKKASQGPFHWSTTSCFSGIAIRALVDWLLTSFHWVRIFQRNKKVAFKNFWFFSIETRDFFFLTVILNISKFFSLMNLVFIVIFFLSFKFLCLWKKKVFSPAIFFSREVDVKTCFLFYFNIHLGSVLK